MLIALLLALVKILLADYCGQFTGCEGCAGRHHVTFEVCQWCSSSNTCVPPSTPCKSIHKEIFDCPRPLEVQYNESFTRDLITPLIAAAQGNHEQIQQCLSRIPSRTQLWKRFFIRSEIGRDKTDGFLAVDFENQAIILSFSSVSSGRRLLFNRFNAEFFNDRQALFEDSEGLVNRFVYDSFNRIWRYLGMEKLLRKVLSYYTHFEIWCVGHSLGGAKAQLAAVSVVRQNLTTQNKVKLITFGATRLGDNSWIQMIEDMVPYRFRIVNRKDMIVRYPRAFEGEWTPPHHHRYEVWYPNGMHPGAFYIICLGAEDPNCSSKLTAWQQRAEDNEFYFGKSMDTWAHTGCSESSAPPKRHEKHPSWKVATTTASTTTTKSTTTILSTTSAVSTLPWWYTTQPWSTPQAAVMSNTTEENQISK